MHYHIIAILGKAGEANKLVNYDKDSSLNIAELKSGDFHNSTHCLIESFTNNASYTFLGTQKSIDYQQSIFANLPQCKAILEKYPPKVLGDSEIQSVFHYILESIKSAPSDNIILDITHGFRHQPIIASFASTLGQINTKKSITLLFAKEIEPREKYQYISLEKYSQISLIALSLQTFVQALSVPDIQALNKNQLIKNLSDFASSLHANAFSQMFERLNDTKKELQKVRNNVEFEGLKNVLDEVERILDKFEKIQKITQKYKQYYEISSFMNEKGYYLIAITYIREAIPLYVIDKIGGLINPNVDYYKKIEAVNNLIQAASSNFSHKDFSSIFKSRDDLECLKEKMTKQNLKWLSKMVRDIAQMRNDLVHINPKKKELKEIKNSLNDTLRKFNNNCIIQDLLKTLNASIL